MDRQVGNKNKALCVCVCVCVCVSVVIHLMHGLLILCLCYRSTFDFAGRLTNQAAGPIKNTTIVKLDAGRGSVLERWGDNMFYMPHGLEIDANGNTWVTDVAMHQVFKVDNNSNNNVDNNNNNNRPFKRYNAHDFSCSSHKAAAHLV